MLLPRLHFPATTPSWFAGHMARSLRELPALLDEVQLVIEARDARLPLTSVNPAFDALLERVWGHAGTGPDRAGRSKEKIVVYTKRDLAEDRYEAPLQQAFWKQARQRTLFADTRSDPDVREVLRLAARTGSKYMDAAPDLKVLVVGMPNVGKSSLLNALRRVGVRKGKAFTTGAMPGITRRLTGTVRVYEEPPIYVYDTPGVMVPYLGRGDIGAERGLKLALTAGIKEGLFEPDAVADYLLYKLNVRLQAEEFFGGDSLSRHTSYTSTLPLAADFQPTNSLTELLDALAGRLGALRKGGERDHEAALIFLLRAFREGRLGRWTLDDLDGEERTFITRFGEAQNGGEPATAVSEIGLVGRRSSSAARETGIDLSSKLDKGSTLSERVSGTIQHFLVSQAEERADADAGRNISINQQKKAQLQAKADVRLARARAKGLDKPHTGLQRQRQRQRRR